MFRTGTLTAFLAVALLACFVLAGSGMASAQATDVYWVAYYSGGATSETTPPAINGSVRIINTGTSGGDLCADIYVFDQREELRECCRCIITPDGLLTLSTFDLTSNPVNDTFPTDGVIKIVSDSACNEFDPNPTPELRSWITNPNNGIVTESEFEAAPLSAQEEANLELLCTGIKGASGEGICAQTNPACTF